jgi:hypothetical protein
MSGAAQQRDAADEGRLEPSGSIIVGKVIVTEGKVVRPSQLIASVRQTRGRTLQPDPRWRTGLTGYGGWAAPVATTNISGTLAKLEANVCGSSMAGNRACATSVALPATDRRHGGVATSSRPWGQGLIESRTLTHYDHYVLAPVGRLKS